MKFKDYLSEALSKTQRQKLLMKVGTDNSKSVVIQRSKDGWSITDTIYVDKKGKANLVSMKKGKGVIIIHPNGAVDTFADKSKITFKEA